jgi:tetratricopeptide (TPR) repeat protein
MPTDNFNWLSLCVDMMHSGLRYNWGDANSMAKFNKLSPHALSIVDLAWKANHHDPSHQDNVVDVLNTLGFGLRYNGAYEASLDCYMRIFSLQDSTLNRRSQLRATLYYNIAWLYEKLRDFDSAIAWYMKDLDITIAVHGREGISTAHTYNSLGTVYEKKKEYNKALGFMKRALYIIKKEFGEQDPEYSVVCNNLASIYAGKEQYEQALKYHWIDLGICEKRYGEKHPDTAVSYANIGSTYHSMGDLHQALNWYRKAIAIRFDVLGAKQPDFESVVLLAAKAYSSINADVPFDVWLADAVKYKDMTDDDE